MFNSVTGEITFKGEERLCLQTGGVEWELTVVPQGAGQAASRRAGRPRLHPPRPPRGLHAPVRVLRRRGAGAFPGPPEGGGSGAARRPEDALRRGPGTSSPQALDRDDVDALSAVPGIGKKTAQKIILTLKGKLTPAAESARRSAEEDIATALVGMGFDRRTARTRGDGRAEGRSAATRLKGEELERELFKRAVAIAGGEAPVKVKNADGK